SPATSTSRSSTARRSRRSTSRAWARWSAWARGWGGRAARTSSSASAASTAATRTRSPSSTTRGSTTSAARRTECRSRGWLLPRRPSLLAEHPERERARGVGTVGVDEPAALGRHGAGLGDGHPVLGRRDDRRGKGGEGEVGDRGVALAQARIRVGDDVLGLAEDAGGGDEDGRRAGAACPLGGDAARALHVALLAELDAAERERPARLLAVMADRNRDQSVGC